MTSPVETWRRISPAYFEGCWNSINRPHRQPILDAIASLMSATSLLEIGCNAGPNLRLIHERWPEVGLGGIDANADALEMVNAKFGDYVVDTWHYDLRDALPQIANLAYDIVLSSYCLAYIEPHEIAGVLAHMVRIARVGLVIAEPMVFDQPEDSFPAGIPEWRYDYHARLYDYHARLCDPATNFPKYSATAVTIDPPVERLNAVLTVRL